MNNRDKKKKRKRKLINTTVIPSRVCLSQVVTILTSCLEKKTGNKSLGDNIWLGLARCSGLPGHEELTPPVVPSLKGFSSFCLVSNQQQEHVASKETSHLLPGLLSPSCSNHPPLEKGRPRIRTSLSCSPHSRGADQVRQAFYVMQIRIFFFFGRFGLLRSLCG